MPCCIGIIQFQRCRHSLLLKLGCTNHCEELCPPEMQVGLVSTNYLWLCEDCHERKTNIDLDDRCNKWADLMMDIPECDAQLRMHIEDAVRAREEYEEVACEKSRVGCIEEIQWVVEWTYEYGIMLYDVLFKKMCEPRKAAARIDDLREMKMHEWDLLVVKDALRSPKVLFEEQSNETYWFINGEYSIRSYQGDVTDRLYYQINSMSSTCYESNYNSPLFATGHRFLCFPGRTKKTRGVQARALIP
ncbi:hypothetical protein ACHAPO_002489 [Fusarium lateritium]